MRLPISPEPFVVPNDRDMVPSERRLFVRTHRTCVLGYGRLHDGPAMSVVYYVPTDEDELLVSTTAGRAKARAVIRNAKISLCVLDERWPFAASAGLRRRGDRSRPGTRRRRPDGCGRPPVRPGAKRRDATRSSSRWPTKRTASCCAVALTRPLPSRDPPRWGTSPSPQASPAPCGGMHRIRIDLRREREVAAEGDVVPADSSPQADAGQLGALGDQTAGTVPDEADLVHAPPSISWARSGILTGPGAGGPGRRQSARAWEPNRCTRRRKWPGGRRRPRRAASSGRRPRRRAGPATLAARPGRRGPLREP